MSSRLPTPRRKPQHLPTWFDAGRDAFAAGLPRIPGADQRVTEALAGLPVGTGAADIMASWTSGWDTANLAQPVD